MEENENKMMTPPIRVDDEVEIDIESKGERGDGVGKKDGFIVFVPGTKVGDKVTVQIEKVFKKFAIGRKMLVADEEAEVKEEE